MTAKPYRLAIDVGGTFTDIVVIDDRNQVVRFGKVLSTPRDPSQGSLAGAAATIAHNRIAASEVGEVVHATTVATNAVLERKGARTGLLTTQGFRDTLAMGRESRYDIYDLGLRLPEALVPRPLRREVVERVAVDGGILTPLDEASVATAVQALQAAGVESVAIALLHSYVNPLHEERVAELVAQLAPDWAISISHRIAGEPREFERTSTAVVDAYVKPMVRRYVEQLAAGLQAAGLPHCFSLMLSHGGIGPAVEVVNAFPVRMIESGPAAGAIAAAYVAREALPTPDAVAFDMGGTTAKMSLVRNGQPSVAHNYEVAHVHRFKRGSGIPLQISAVELLEIGAGGGSIAQISNLGLLTVGPRSAGAEPGPACYAQGGTEPTVTDADLVLGYLNAGFFLGGDLRLDRDSSRRAIAGRLAEPLGLSVEAAAWGVHDVVNESMAAAVRAHAAEQGVDLRRFGLIAFGGAGPVHAYALARKLGLSRIICPYGAGVASAIGCLVAAPAVDFVSVYVARLDHCDWREVANRFAAMDESGRAVIAGLVGSNQTRLTGTLEMRCEGQGYSVMVPVPAGAAFAEALAAPVAVAFEAAYRERYGHAPPAVPLEVVSLRARIAYPRNVSAIRPPPATTTGPLRKGSRPVYFEAARGFIDTPVYDRYALVVSAAAIVGPAIIEERETSIVVGPDARFRYDDHGHVIVELT